MGAAKRLVADELAKRSWTMFGMTGSSWSGVAERRGVTLVVGVLPFDPVLTRSGRGTVWQGLSRPMKCRGCMGKTVDAEGEECEDCGGMGGVRKSVPVSLNVWPTFQANGQGEDWHVEVGGVKFASGRMLKAVAAIPARAPLFADRIDQAAEVVEKVSKDTKVAMPPPVVIPLHTTSPKPN